MPKFLCHTLLATVAGPLMMMSNGAAQEDPDAVTLSKVPAQATLTTGAGTDDKKIDQWIATLIQGKEKQAKRELEAIKAELIEEQKVRQAEERERKRREQRLEETFGALGTGQRLEAPAPLRIKLDFQVPEIETYTQIILALEKEQALATEIVDTLKRLDRDQDNQLTLDEYRDAGALLTTTRRMFEKLDADNDGQIVQSELTSVLELPENSVAAVIRGRPSTDNAAFRIKPYDAKDDGVLDVTERKTLTMAYVDVALKSEKEAAFYRGVLAKLSSARGVVAAKFEDIEIAVDRLFEEAPKKVEPPKDESIKVEPKKDESKKEDSKKEESKKEDPKKEAPK